MPNYTRGNYRFVDTWLIAHTFLSIFYFICANIESVPTSVKYILLIYGALRVFEIFIYQLNVIFVHPYNDKNYSLYSYRRMTIALIHNFFEIVFWFAGTYLVFHFISDPETAIYRSFTHMVSYSMAIDEWSSIAFFILQFQALIGVFMTVLSLARFISLFPQPRSMDELEQEANDLRFERIVEEIQELSKNVSDQLKNTKQYEDLCKRIEKLEKKIDGLSNQNEIENQ